MSQNAAGGTVLPFPHPPEEWEQGLKRKGGSPKGDIISCPFNAYLYFKYHPAFRGHIRWNKVSLRVEVSGGVLAQCPNVEDFDTVITKAQDTLASVFEIYLGREEVGRRLAYVAEESAYDPLRDYLDGLSWDGKPRVDTWLSDYAGARPTDPDDGYVRFVGRKWLLACVARAFHPGCKADVVLVAEGDQGTYKSTMFSILGGPWYSEAAGVLGDKDSKQLIGAAWICELPDMSSFSRTNRNQMKAFFSSPVDRYRPPYGKHHVAVPRRCVFAATTNDEEYLGDPTGNRRFQPVQLGEIRRSALIRDRDKLWAEAVFLYKAAANCEACMEVDVQVPGETGRCPDHAWWLTGEEKSVARVHAQLREETDSWGQAVLRYADTPTGLDEDGKPATATTANILVRALRFDLRDVDRNDEMRVAAILRRAGYVREKRGKDVPWVPGPSHPSYGKPAAAAHHPSAAESIAAELT